MLAAQEHLQASLKDLMEANEKIVVLKNNKSDLTGKIQDVKEDLKNSEAYIVEKENEIFGLRRDLCTMKIEPTEKHEKEASELKRKEKKQKRETKKYPQLEAERIKAIRGAAEKEMEEPNTDYEPVPNVKVANSFENLPSDVTELEPDLNFNTNMAKESTNSLVSNSLDLVTMSSMDSFNSSLILDTSLDTNTSLVTSMNLDLSYSKSFAINSAATPSSDSVQSSRALTIPWKCEICEANIPWGLTMEQALHMEKHKKEMKLRGHT